MMLSATISLVVYPAKSLLSRLTFLIYPLVSRVFLTPSMRDASRLLDLKNISKMAHHMMVVLSIAARWVIVLHGTSEFLESQPSLTWKSYIKLYLVFSWPV